MGAPRTTYPRKMHKSIPRGVRQHQSPGDDSLSPPPFCRDLYMCVWQAQKRTAFAVARVAPAAKLSRSACLKPMPATAANASVADSVAAFIACIEAENLAPEARLARLAPALDRLSLAYHDGADLDKAPSEAEPPQRDYQALRELIAGRFPDLGYYGAAPPGETLDAEITIGDAIDDLADIYSELLDVAWCLQHTNADDATRLFRFGFSHHWGRHVCDVRGALHYELFGM